MTQTASPVPTGASPGPSDDELRLIGGGDNNNFVHGFVLASEGSRRRGFDQRRTKPQIAKNSFGLLTSMAEQQRTVLFVSFELLDVREQLLLGFEPKPFDFANQSLFACRFQVGYRFDAQCLVERNDFL